MIVNDGTSLTIKFILMMGTNERFYLGVNLLSWKHPSEGYGIFKVLLKRLVEEPAEVCNYNACRV